MQEPLNKIDGYKKVIDAHRPLKPEEVKALDDYFRIGLTYSSNAIEGNTLTITETKVLLEDGLTIGAAAGLCLRHISATQVFSEKTHCVVEAGHGALGGMLY